MTDNKYVEIGGAKSSDFAPRYDQIPASALRRIAQRFSKGNKKFDGPEAAYLGGEMNWQKGDGAFFRERFNHIIEHLNRWKAECEDPINFTGDDDLAAAAWGCIVLMWAEENDKIRMPLCDKPETTTETTDTDKCPGALDCLGCEYCEPTEQSATDKVLSFFGLK